MVSTSKLIFSILFLSFLSTITARTIYNFYTNYETKKIEQIISNNYTSFKKKFGKWERAFIPDPKEGPTEIFIFEVNDSTYNLLKKTVKNVISKNWITYTKERLSGKTREEAFLKTFYQYTLSLYNIEKKDNYSETTVIDFIPFFIYKSDKVIKNIAKKKAGTLCSTISLSYGIAYSIIKVDTLLKIQSLKNKNGLYHSVLLLLKDSITVSSPVKGINGYKTPLNAFKNYKTIKTYKTLPTKKLIKETIKRLKIK